MEINDVIATHFTEKDVTKDNNVLIYGTVDKHYGRYLKEIKLTDGENEITFYFCTRLSILNDNEVDIEALIPANSEEAIKLTSIFTFYDSVALEVIETKENQFINRLLKQSSPLWRIFRKHIDVSRDDFTTIRLSLQRF